LGKQREKLTVSIDGRGLLKDQTVTLDLPPRETVQQVFAFRLSEKIGPGRQVFCLRIDGANGPEGTEAFFAVDVDP
jgi:hypothetical protein